MTYFKPLATAAAILPLMAAPLFAQTKITMVIEQQQSWLQNFNPFDTVGSRDSTGDFIYEPLVIFDTLAGGGPQFRLATAYAYSDDLTAITFTMREGVQWSDGTPLTAEDVKFSVELMMGNPAIDFLGLSGLVTSVELPAPGLVQINLQQPQSTAIETLKNLPVVPAHIWTDVADPATFRNENPVGSGPLTEIARFTPQIYEQCRNPYYWDAASLAVDCITLPQVSSNDQLLAMLPEGNIDWFGDFIPNVEQTFVSLDPANNLVWLPPAETVALQLNLASSNAGNAEAFNDLQFRRAASLTLEREAIVDIAGYGYPTVATTAGLMPQRYTGWENSEIGDEQNQWLVFDVAQANALLDAAGYTQRDAEGFRMTPSGLPIAFAIEVPVGWTDWMETVQIAMEGLRAAGINATLGTPEFAVWSNRGINGELDAMINWVQIPGSTPWRSYFDAFHSSSAGRSRDAASHYSTPEIDALLEAFNATASVDEHHRIMNEIQAIIAADLPVLPIQNSPTWVDVSQKRVTGWASAENPFVNPSPKSDNPARLLQLLALRPVE